MNRLVTSNAFVSIVIVVFLSVDLSANEVGSQIVIAEFDRSGSVGENGVADYHAVLAEHLFSVSELSQGKLRVAMIMYGDTVTEIADKSGRPTSANASLRKRVADALSQSPNGGTNIPAAFKATISMLGRIREQSPDTPVTILSMGDGVGSEPIVPGQYAEIDEALEEAKAAARVEDGEQGVVAYLERLNTPRSEEWEQIHRLQAPLTHGRTLQLAQTLKSYANVRFISLSYAPDLQPLKEIHNAIGLPSDFVELKNEETLTKLHQLNIFSHVVSHPVVDIEPSDRENATEVVPLTPDLPEARTLVTAEFPLRDGFEEKAIFGFQVGSERHATSGGGALRIARRSNGQLSTISLLCPPADTVKLGFKGSEMTFPGARIYRFSALEGIELIVRPETAAQEDESPYELYRENHNYLVGLMADEGHKAIPMDSAVVKFIHTENGKEHVVECVASRYPNLFIAEEQDLPPGVYTVTADLVTKRSKTSLSITLPNHVSISQADEFLKISAKGLALDRTEFGVMGDDRNGPTESTLEVTNGSAVPLGLVFEVVDLKSSDGEPIGEPWVTIQRNITISAGATIPVTLTATLPEDIATSIPDGLVTGRLEIRNAETGQDVRVVPLLESVATAESLKTVQLTIRRPVLYATAPRGLTRDLLSTVDQQNVLRLNANVSHPPYQRFANLDLWTDSNIDRDFYLQLAQLKNSDGDLQDDVTLDPDPRYEAGKFRIRAGERVTVQLPFKVQKALTKGKGVLLVTSKGMRPFVVQIEAGSSGEYGVWIGYTANFACLVFALIAVLSILRVARAAGHCASRAASTTTESIQNVASAEIGDETVLIQSLCANVSYALDFPIHKEDLHPLDRAVPVPRDSPVFLKTAVGQIIKLTNFDSETDKCSAEVLSGGEFESERTRATLNTAFFSLLTLLAVTIGVGITRWLFVVELVQWIVDSAYLS